MMNMGRPRTSNKLKELRGTDQPVRMNKAEVEYSRVTKVSVPSILKTTRARKIYKERAQVLINMGLLCEPDQDLLVAYAYTLDMYYIAMKEQSERGLVETVITKNGSYEVPSAYLKIQKDLLEQVNRLAQHFGFSPSSRASLKVDVKKDDKSEFEKTFS